MEALIHNNPKDLITVVIAMYNGEKTIVLAINSIFEQTHKDINIIICDDDSSDNSVAKVLALDNSKITLLRNNTNQGLSKTRKKLLSAVKTKWIAFIDQDDTWEKNKIERQINLLKVEKCGMSHTHYYYIAPFLNSKKVIKSKSKIYYKDMLSGKCVGASSVLINTEYFDNLTAFCDDRCLDPVNDYVIWLNLLRNSNNHSLCIEEPLMNYYFHGANLSANKLKQLYRHFYVLKNIEKISFSKLPYYIFLNFYNKLKAYIL
jgi:teichuronic acid biosynthesis glycosyltransferase TuaG